jgi:hypothetical protein
MTYIYMVSLTRALVRSDLLAAALSAKHTLRERYHLRWGYRWRNISKHWKSLHCRGNPPTKVSKNHPSNEFANGIRWGVAHRVEAINQLQWGVVHRLR